ncbi:hypothetical protein niasHT_024236 [Heterodera trifolii]|uniref:Protein alan shepard n=1 Tax=Heterodera trifolii TaxID=157864 RepID=A0ABD2JM01_9BILA
MASKADITQLPTTSSTVQSPAAHPTAEGSVNLRHASPSSQTRFAARNTNKLNKSNNGANSSRRPHQLENQNTSESLALSAFVQSSSCSANDQDNNLDGRNSLHENYDNYDSPSVGAPGNRILSETNLYIRGLDEECTDERLRQMCSRFGKIVSTKAILDKATKKCKGYGFVDFESSASARDAIEGLEKEGISAQMAKQQEQDPTNLYIANLPPEYNEDKLTDLLKEFGMVISSRVLRHPDGSSRGVGFCRMGCTDSCDSIIAKYNGRKLPNAQAHLIVKFADSSSRKFKRSTPSLRSVYSESCYKPKGGVPPLLTTPFIEPTFNQTGYQFGGTLPNPSAHYGPSFYNTEMLGQQFNQMSLVTNGGQQQQDTMAQQQPFFYNPYSPYLPYQYLSPQQYTTVVLQQQLQPDYSLTAEQQLAQHTQVAQIQQPSTASLASSLPAHHQQLLQTQPLLLPQQQHFQPVRLGTMTSSAVLTEQQQSTQQQQQLQNFAGVVANIPSSAVPQNTQQQQMAAVSPAQVMWTQPQQAQQSQAHQQQQQQQMLRHQKKVHVPQQMASSSMGPSFF